MHPPHAPVPSLTGSRTVAAFTLTELLAVIAIIGILAAIIIPTVGRVRESARSAACLSNLRQIAVAGRIYAANNRDVIVPIYAPDSNDVKVTWRIQLAAYIGADQGGKLPKADTLLCPVDAAQFPPYGGNNTDGKFPFSYGLNKTAKIHRYSEIVQEANLSTRLSAIVNPARLIMVCDIARPSSGTVNKTTSGNWQDNRTEASSNFGYARFPDDPGFIGSDAWTIFPRHGRKANVAFYDGHAAAVDVDKDILAKTAGTPGCLYMNE